MFTLITVVAILAGLFFRSVNGLIFSLLALFLLLYPLQTIGFLIACGVFYFFHNRSNSDAHSNKLNSRSRDKR